MELMIKYIVCSFLWMIFTNNIYAQSKFKIEKPAIQLASQYHSDIQIQNYLVSEKLDGVRARWNGERLITRSGLTINTPKWFIHEFPNQTLDGELWIGRNKFDQVSGIVRQKTVDNEQWKKITFNVFDLPLSKAPFLTRYNILQELFSTQLSPYIVLIDQKELDSKTVLNDWLNLIEIKRGEGLMLHHKASLYEYKRSKSLLKLKKVYDAEAFVVAHINGKGKYKGMLGAMLMEMPNGTQFKLGSGLSDAQRVNPPAIGAVITYQYYGLTKNGKPRFASYLRIRNK